jgi:hypothetical protein
MPSLYDACAFILTDLIRPSQCYRLAAVFHLEALTTKKLRAVAICSFIRAPAPGKKFPSPYILTPDFSPPKLEIPKRRYRRKTSSRIFFPSVAGLLEASEWNSSAGESTITNNGGVVIEAGGGFTFFGDSSTADSPPSLTTREWLAEQGAATRYSQATQPQPMLSLSTMVASSVAHLGREWFSPANRPQVIQH